MAAAQNPGSLRTQALTGAVIAALPPDLDALYSPQPFETAGPVSLARKGDVLAFISHDAGWGIVTAKLYLPSGFDEEDLDTMVAALTADTPADKQLVVVIIPDAGDGNGEMEAVRARTTMRTHGLKEYSWWVYKLGGSGRVACAHLRRYTMRQVLEENAVKGIMTSFLTCSGHDYLTDLYYQCQDMREDEELTAGTDHRLDDLELWVLYETAGEERACAVAATMSERPRLSILALCAPLTGSGLDLFSGIKRAATAAGFGELYMEAANPQLLAYYARVYGMVPVTSPRDDIDDDDMGLRMDLTVRK